ncbi:MAG: site-specific integrase, partial [Clostridia bacterium]|nr:site-specific integrase [Clostridia bacterium]
MKILEGCITHRKDGRWETRLVIAGKQVSTACCKNKTTAIEKHNNVVREQRELRKQLVAPTQYTLKTWIVKWFETYKKEKIDSWKNYERTINNHILPNCPDVKLSKVTELVITAVLNKMPTDRIRRDCYLVFNQALHIAYTNRLIQWDVSTALTKPKVDEGEGKAMTDEEVERLLSFANGTKYKPVIEWYLVTGCRPRELFNIKLSDVGKNYITIPGTKTKSSKRIIPIFEKTKELLKTDLSNNKPLLIGTV